MYFQRRCIVLTFISLWQQFRLGLQFVDPCYVRDIPLHDRVEIAHVSDLAAVPRGTAQSFPVAARQYSLDQVISRDRFSRRR